MTPTRQLRRLRQLRISRQTPCWSWGVVLLWGVAGCSTALRKPRQAKANTPTLTVMSYNVNFGLAGDDSVVGAIRTANADLVLLQETTPAWERVLRRQLRARYPHIAFHHSRGAGGLGILSRSPVFATQLMSSPIGWFPAWRMVVDSAMGRVQVLQVHLRPPVSDSGSWVSGYFTTGGHRRRELEHFSRALDLNQPTLVAGDFNEKRGQAVRLLLKRGLRSALPEFKPSATTWRWETAIGELTFALDHIFYSRQLEPLDCWVMKRGQSDHLPVVAVFQRATPSG